MFTILQAWTGGGTCERKIGEEDIGVMISFLIAKITKIRKN